MLLEYEKGLAHHDLELGVVGQCTYGLDHLGPHGQLEIGQPSVTRPSVASLFLEMQQAGKKIGTATGFIVVRDAKRYLITNRHVVRGLQSAGPIIPPDHFVIAQHVAGKLGTWEPRTEQLYDKTGRPRWFEHPSRPVEIDVAALPLANDAGIDVYPYDPWSPGPGMAAGVSEPLHIIGFPFGVSGGGALGIWVRGFTATEPDLDWNGLPCFLVDSRTRDGQSGSPVIAYSAGGPTAMAGGGLALGGPPMEQFFGVYSGRINRESDLGIVWKAQAVRDVIEGKKRAVP
jgi:hypothetical protein